MLRPTDSVVLFLSLSFSLFDTLLTLQKCSRSFLISALGRWTSFAHFRPETTSQNEIHFSDAFWPDDLGLCRKPRHNHRKTSVLCRLADRCSATLTDKKAPAAAARRLEISLGR
jgi:hypothetical protein